MPNVRYLPFTPNGIVSAPPSKSDVHRAVICAALSGGVCKISPVALSNDIKATIGCAQALGAKTTLCGSTLTVDGSRIFSNPSARLDCRESGSTLRFFVPIASAAGISADFTGSGSLLTRPIGLFSELLPKAGVECKTSGVLPLSVSGQLKSGEFTVSGGISSQFITGLLLALPLLDGNSKIILSSPLQSEGYIDMTVRTMKLFGVTAERTDYGWSVKGNQRYLPRDYTTDGDWSQAAFYMVSAAINGSVTVKGVRRDSAQGDKKIAELLREFGAEVIQSEEGVTVSSRQMNAIEIDASQIPDLVPALAVCASFARGTTRIFNAQRLRIKESDRLKSTAALLNSLGGNVRELDDGLEITYSKRLRGGLADGFNDHRIVMSAAACASGSEGEIVCTDALSVNKSYPQFFNDYNSVGGKAELTDL